MNKVLRISALLILLLILTLSMALPVYAISSTYTLLQLNQCDAYHYLTEAYDPNDTTKYDMAFFIDFTITYAETPIEPISDTFIIRLMDTDGTTEITSVTPYAFFDNGYNRGVAYIHLTSDQVAAAGIAYEDALVIRLDGNPLASWSESTPSATPLTTINWSNTSTQGATRLVVEAKIRALASALQTSWNNSGYILLSNYASGGVLTTVGESYFSVVISNLSDIAPGVLGATNVEPEYIDRVYEDNTEDAIITDITDTPLDLTGLATAIKPGLDPIVITSLLALAVLVYVGIRTRNSTQNYKPIILVSIPVIVILTRMHFIAMWLTILLAFVAGVMIFYTFFYEKSSG